MKNFNIQFRGLHFYNPIFPLEGNYKLVTPVHYSKSNPTELCNQRVGGANTKIKCNNFSGKPNNNVLNPYYLTGFTDGEGCFLINVRPNNKMKTKYSIELVFKITLLFKDKALLEEIKYFFSVGTVTKRSDGAIQY